MRKKILGAVAALLAGGTATQAQYTNPPIPAMIPGPNGAPTPQLVPGPGMIPPGADPRQMLPPNYQPTYPPPGPYGQTMYESPYLAGGPGGSGGPGGGFDGPVAPRVWFKGDYLLMFLRPQPSDNVLVTTGRPNVGSDNGVLGEGSTVTLVGQENFRTNPAGGFRLEGGLWGGTDQRVGVTVGAFYIPPASVKFETATAGGGTPLLGRPFVNANPNVATINGNNGGADIALISSPTLGNGSVLVQATTRVWGIDPSLLVNLYRSEPGGDGWSLNFIVGYRFMELQESLLVRSNTTLAADTIFNNVTIVGGSNVGVRDYFDARNHFNGGQVGLESQATRGRWYFGATGKVAFGVNSQRVLVDGNTTDFGANNFVGGVFANSSNIGSYRMDRFAIATDLNATLGFMLTPRLIATAGYNFISLSNVARPGNAVNANIDPVTAPGIANVPAVPASGTATGFDLKRDDFYMHGLNFGFIVKY